MATRNTSLASLLKQLPKDQRDRIKRAAERIISARRGSAMVARKRFARYDGLPANIRTRRIERNLSQSELGAAAGISRAAVCAIEFGRCDPSVASLVAFAQRLDCSVDWLLGLDR